MTLLYISAAFIMLTAFAHSYFGEKRLIQPILNSDLGVATAPLGRMVIRLAWHLTTILMLLNAAVMIWPDAPRQLVAVTAGVWLAIGLIDAVLTKGQHIGWPPITAAGAFGLWGIYG